MCRGRLRAHTTVNMKFKELFRVAKTFGVKRLEKLKLLRKKPQKRCAGAWNSLPSIAFEKILLFLVQQSVEDLHKCRMVCKSWNNRIKNEFCIINRREVVQQRMNFNWKEGLYPSRCEVLQAKKAVRYGLLDQTKVEDFVMRIKIAMYGGYGDHPQCELRPNFTKMQSFLFPKIGFPSRISRIGDFTRGKCNGIQCTHVYTLKIKVLVRAPSRDSDYILLPSEKGVFYIKCPLIFFSLQTVLTKDFNSIQSCNKSIKYRGMVFIHYYHQIKPNAYSLAQNLVFNHSPTLKIHHSCRIKTN